jgi:hypothetical protein
MAAVKFMVIYPRPKNIEAHIQGRSATKAEATSSGVL